MKPQTADLLSQAKKMIEEAETIVNQCAQDAAAANDVLLFEELDIISVRLIIVWRRLSRLTAKPD